MSVSPLSRPDVWNAVATGYTADLVPLFAAYARDALRLAALPPGARVLDVAAGPGTLALLAAEHASEVVAVDFAAEMIATLRRRVAEEGVGTVTAVEADGQALPFDAGRFDGVFSMFGLIFFPDPAAGLREAHRVLVPGGRIAVSSWAPLGGIPLLSACFRAMKEHLPWLPFGDQAAPFGDPESLLDALRSAGFEDVAVHTVAHRADAASVAAFWETNERSSAPLVLLRQQLSAAEWEALGASVVDQLRREFGEGEVAMAWPARIAVGTKR